MDIDLSKNTQNTGHYMMPAKHEVDDLAEGNLASWVVSDRNLEL